jgi:hypothetical protein
MDLVIGNVGRRSKEWGKQGDPTDVGDNSLNGYERNALFRGRGDGRFEDVAHLVGANRIEDGRGVAVADFDRDGHLDLLLQSLDRPAVLLMGQGGGGHWLQLDLRGAGANRDAVGATVIAHVGERRMTRQRIVGTGFLSVSSPILHFGLGDATQVDALEIRWPGGERQLLREVRADQRVTVVQGEDVAAR